MKRTYMCAGVLTLAVALPLTIAPMTARAAPGTVTGDFDATLNNDLSSDFASNGFTSSAGDTVAITFSYTAGSPGNSFSLSMDDLDTLSNFAFPAVALASATVSLIGGEYTADVVYDAEFPSTSTPFTATFLLDLGGTSITGGPPSMVEAVGGGTGSLEIDAPTAAGGPLDQTIGFTVPEPATISILGFALAGLAGMKRRRARG